MKELETIWNERTYAHGPTYTKDLALLVQPGAFTDFGRHADFHEVYRRWTQGDGFRGLDIVRVWSLLFNAKHVLSKAKGSLAELGVYKGQCSSVLSYFAEQFDRKMYMLDTFEGFSEAQYEDDMGEGKQAAFKDTSLEAAQGVVGSYSGNRWVIGMFPDSATEELQNDSFAFVSIDCDLYEPIAAGLEFFWPRLSPRGMIFVHDYSSGHWPGATKAVDEFCEANGLQAVLLPDLAGSCVLARGGAV